MTGDGRKNAGLADEKGGDGRGQRGQGNPDGGSVEGVAHRLCLALALVVGGDVDEVVLLEVEGGRLEQALHLGEVHEVDLVHAVDLTGDHDTGAVAVDGEVAGAAEGVENGEMVLRDGDDAGVVHLAEHVHAEVDILYGDDGVVDEFAGAETLLDVGGELLAGLAFGADFAEYGKLDGALFVDGVDYLRPGGGVLLAADGEGELLLEHGVAAVHVDFHAVFGSQAELLAGGYGHAVEGFGVLEIGHVAGHGTGGHAQQETEGSGKDKKVTRSGGAEAMGNVHGIYFGNERSGRGEWAGEGDAPGLWPC